MTSAWLCRHVAPVFTGTNALGIEIRQLCSLSEFESELLGGSFFEKSVLVLLKGNKSIERAYQYF
jgi:hypothetical protein